MKCPTCGNTELMVNGVKDGLISYVCWNPSCPQYKQAFTATGEATTTLVLTKEEADALKAKEEQTSSEETPITETGV